MLARARLILEEAAVELREPALMGDCDCLRPAVDAEFYKYPLDVRSGAARSDGAAAAASADF